MAVTTLIRMPGFGSSFFHFSTIVPIILSALFAYCAKKHHLLVPRMLDNFLYISGRPLAIFSPAYRIVAENCWHLILAILLKSAIC